MLHDEELAVDIDHPLSVLLADVFEGTLTLHEVSLRRALAYLLPEDEELKEDAIESPDAKTLIAVAHFRHAAKHLVRTFLEVSERGGQREDLGEDALMVLRVLDDSLRQSSRSQGLIIYIFKLLR